MLRINGISGICYSEQEILAEIPLVLVITEQDVKFIVDNLPSNTQEIQIKFTAPVEINGYKKTKITFSGNATLQTK